MYFTSSKWNLIFRHRIINDGIGSKQIWAAFKSILSTTLELKIYKFLWICHYRRLWLHANLATCLVVLALFHTNNAFQRWKLSGKNIYGFCFAAVMKYVSRPFFLHTWFIVWRLCQFLAFDSVELNLHARTGWGSITSWIMQIKCMKSRNSCHLSGCDNLHLHFLNPMKMIWFC